MRVATDVFIGCLLVNWRRALREILSLIAIFAMVMALFAVMLFTYDLYDPLPGIQSAEHRAVVKAHVVRGK